MNTQLFIPDKIKVGYQERNDTYTKRLAYVIYYDKKGVLRKEQSWQGWIQKRNENVFLGYETKSDGTFDYKKPKYGVKEAMPIDDYENVPTEGFVLNKGAGGHAGSSSSWNIRRETIRVYDPRGFEFEISIANLLFILENSNSYKGKGLEGEFVYSWDGKELVLIPVSCKEYQDSKGFTDLQDQKVSAKTLVLGATYETKKQEKLVYIGRYDWFTFDYERNYTDKIGKVTKRYVFRNDGGNFVTQSGLASLARVTDNSCISNYSDLVEELQTKHAFNLAKPLEFVEKEVKENVFKEAKINSYIDRRLVRKINTNKYECVLVYCAQNYEQKKQSWGLGTQDDMSKPLGKRYMLNETASISMNSDNRIISESNRSHNYRWQDKKYTLEDIVAMNFKELHIKYDNGKTTKLDI